MEKGLAAATEETPPLAESEPQATSTPIENAADVERPYDKKPQQQEASKIPSSPAKPPANQNRGKQKQKPNQKGREAAMADSSNNKQQEEKAIDASIEEIFAPRDLESVVDDADKEVELFKRALNNPGQAGPVAGERKKLSVNVNINMLNIKAKPKS
jgi:hypothetical protein